jgi:hypothetical protein
MNNEREVVRKWISHRAVSRCKVSVLKKDLEGGSNKRKCMRIVKQYTPE